MTQESKKKGKTESVLENIVAMLISDIGIVSRNM